MPVLENDVAEVEGGIDVAVGVEDVLDQAIDAALAQAGEIGTDFAPFAVDLVTGEAVFGEDFLTGVGIEMLCRAESGAAISDQLLGLLLGREDAAGELLQSLVEIRHVRRRQTIVDA